MLVPGSVIVTGRDGILHTIPLAEAVKIESPPTATVTWSKSISQLSTPSPPSTPIVGVVWTNRSSPLPPEIGHHRSRT